MRKALNRKVVLSELDSQGYAMTAGNHHSNVRGPYAEIVLVLDIDNFARHWWARRWRHQPLQLGWRLALAQCCMPCRDERGAHACALLLGARAYLQH